MPVAVPDLGSDSETAGGTRQQGHQRKRQEHDHRDEYELLSRHIGLAVLEAHARERGLGHHERDEQQGVEVAARGHRDRDRHRHDEEEHGGDRGHAALAPIGLTLAPLTGLRDQLIGTAPSHRSSA